jgi:hypothetical protein
MLSILEQTIATGRKIRLRSFGEAQNLRLYTALVQTSATVLILPFIDLIIILIILISNVNNNQEWEE